MMRAIIFIAMLVPGLAVAGDLQPREGWRIVPTDLAYPDLIERLLEAVPEAGMGVVTQAGPTAAARDRGIEIPGNRVIGVFNNDVAVRLLALSTAAMIEAPIRFYVTEDAGGTATLSWKTPSFVLAPYSDEGGAELEAISAELDAKFDAIAEAATATDRQ
jgi:uncharacterized protein (DUF302 family)